MPHILHAWPFLVAGWLFCCGLWGIITSRHLVHAVVCLAILQSSTYVLLLGIGYRVGGAAPVFSDIDPHTLTVDPVVQALMLTDVVVEAVVVALLLAMVIKAHERSGSVSPSDLRTVRG
ncbi:sodium:proton antiporter [Terriglobus aquaticus]|uniref:Sodium:proton antiporter n=1 Tax=Terriglobus aquaticus TaxID=940139 RepID=A0ABW9KI62_9BACT|nr:NADH-quinone oxidoreductase subunit K [Terriglobus aquaticus]